RATSPCPGTVPLIRPAGHTLFIPPRLAGVGGGVWRRQATLTHSDLAREPKAGPLSGRPRSDAQSPALASMPSRCIGAPHREGRYRAAPKTLDLLWIRAGDDAER